MKELSIEEKAKRYDEALEKARQIHDADRVSGIELTTCEEIFPELCESGDERIRKALITYFSDKDESYDGIPYPNIRAWLEKQGEIIKEWSEMKINNIQTELQEMVDLKQKTEQGEQKPAWSEEDRETIDYLIDYLESELDSSYTKEDKEEFTKEIELLKSLKDRVQPQPKQKWSDVDKDILFRTIDSLKFLKDAINTNPNYAVNIIDIEREITWLKSLKPQNTWKPSERQIYLLNWVANILLKDDGIVEKETAKELQQLLEQLKKLREE